MSVLKFYCQSVFASAIFCVALALPSAAQDCRSSQTDICRSLTPNSNVLSTLPEALQVRNNQQVTIHLTNVSPLELCKLTSTSFTPEPPSSALQGAVTAVMGIAPFGMGKSLERSTGSVEALTKLYSPKHFDPIKEPLEAALQEQSEVIEGAKNLFDLQIRKQQEGNALAILYSTFSITDYRGNSAFDSDFSKLSGGLADNLKFVPPGQIGARNGAFPKPDPSAPLIIDLQQELDEAKSLIATAHSIYDKDPKKLDEVREKFVASDRLQSTATQILTLIAASDSALKTQQTNLTTLKIAIDQLQRTVYNGTTPKVSADFPIPRAKNGKITGAITCLNRLDNSKVTLDPMPYSVDYQIIPILGFSAGILLSPIPKQEFGTQVVKDTNSPPPTPPTPVSTFSQVALTDSSSLQVVPFSFLSLRLTPGWSYRPTKSGACQRP